MVKDYLLMPCRFIFATPTRCFDPLMGLARLAVLFYLSVLPFTHNAALKNLALLCMLIVLVWLASRRCLAVDWRSPILLALGGLLLVLGGTSAIGVNAFDSFGELRKYFLPGVLMLILIPQVFQGERLVYLVLLVISCSFMVRAGLTLIELGYYYPNLDAGRSEGYFIKGFSMDASFYLPCLASLMLLQGRWWFLWAFCQLAVLTAMVLTQTRTPMVAAIVSLAVMLLALRKWRMIIGLIALSLIVTSYLAISQPQIAQRFASTFSVQTYRQALDTEHFVASEGLAARMPIWFGVLEITEPHSLTGYGFGWKKLGLIAVNNGYVARWAAREDDAFSQEQATYFSLSPSKVNPHNLFLQIYFESGLLGVMAYMVLLSVLCWQACRIFFLRGGAVSDCVVAALVIAYLVGHILLGLTNGLWIGHGPSLALIALLEMIRRDGRKYRESSHYPS